MLMQRAKDEPDYDRPYDEVHEAFKEADDE